jgi:hypothetical protein
MPSTIQTIDVSLAPVRSSDRHAAAPAAPIPEPPRKEPAAEPAVEARTDKPPDTAPTGLREGELPLDGYRLSFDSEKGRVYLELVNPTTGEVIQRLPRDDLQEALGALMSRDTDRETRGRFDVSV